MIALDALTALTRAACVVFLTTVAVWGGRGMWRGLCGWCGLDEERR